MKVFVERYINPLTDCGFKNSLKYYSDLKKSLDTARGEH